VLKKIQPRSRRSQLLYIPLSNFYFILQWRRIISFSLIFRTLLGKDDEEVHIAARFLAEKLDLSKPALFSFCVKDLGPKVLKALVEVLKVNLQ
jgi:Proteasome assembly chaperone 3